jgi:alkanesulfonate monooxygenase SsuD/methylene tetrahydromethanopterin reductase-like flavin-dependent oxidoreductase (luciferase family)
MPAPMILAAAMATRTKTLRIIIGALLLPLHDPVSVVEEMVVLDHVSRGRVSYTFGLGYRPDEYALYGVPIEHRGAIANEKLDQVLELLKASSAATQRIRVTPAPYRPRGPRIAWGGQSKAAARRAGSRGLDFQGSGRVPGIEEAYAEAAHASGFEPGRFSAAVPGNPATIFVSDDLDRAWADVGPYLLHDASMYAQWNEKSVGVGNVSHGQTVDELRAELGAHRIFTVDEAVAYARASGSLPRHPLCGGLPPEIAWPYLQAAVREVIPRVTPE